MNIEIRIQDIIGITMDLYKEYIEPLIVIKEEQLLTWQEVAKDLGIAYQTMLRIARPSSSILSIRTRKKIRRFLKKNIRKG